MKKVILICLVAASVLSCNTENTSSTSAPVKEEQIEKQEESTSDNAITISKKDFKEWPLTVEGGQLSCENGNVILLAEGTLYGVNGTGSTYAKEHGGKSISDIQAIDLKKQKELIDVGVPKENAKVFMDISEILKKGESLCQ